MLTRRNDDSIAKQSQMWTLQGKVAIKIQLEKRSLERNVDDEFYVELEDDGDGNSRRSWMCLQLTTNNKIFSLKNKNNCIFKSKKHYLEQRGIS